MFVGNAWLSAGVVNIDSGVRDVQLRSDLAFIYIHTAHSCMYASEQTTTFYMSEYTTLAMT